MATKPTSKKVSRATVATEVTEKAKIFTFTGYLHNFRPIDGSKNYEVYFETLNKSRTGFTIVRTVLEDYIKLKDFYGNAEKGIEKPIINVTIEELEPVNNRRQFKLLGIVSTERLADLERLANHVAKA
jgi:hypothetical protein